MAEIPFPQWKLQTTEEADLSELWDALEHLTAPRVSERRAGLTILDELDAPKQSPLVAYLLATRLTDPDVRFRAEVIKTLSEIINPGDNGLPPFDVRRHLKGYHAVIGRGTVLATLEAAEVDPASVSHIADLFKLWPHTGAILADIATKRTISVSIRRQAIHFIGNVGFVETIPQLERLADRLESRANGQKRMTFAPQSEDGDECSLLSNVQATLTLLKAL
jgi:hypothetical protein